MKRDGEWQLFSASKARNYPIGVLNSFQCERLGRGSPHNTAFRPLLCLDLWTFIPESPACEAPSRHAADAFPVSIADREVRDLPSPEGLLPLPPKSSTPPASSAGAAGGRANDNQPAPSWPSTAA